MHELDESVAEPVKGKRLTLVTFLVFVAIKRPLIRISKRTVQRWSIEVRD